MQEQLCDGGGISCSEEVNKGNRTPLDVQEDVQRMGTGQEESNLNVTTTYLVQHKSSVVDFLNKSNSKKQKSEKLQNAAYQQLMQLSFKNQSTATQQVHVNNQMVKREFGFPNDLLVNLVPKYPEYFKLIGEPGEGKSFLQLVEWNPEFAKSVIEVRAEEESRLTGIKTRPAFNWKLPPGFFIRKEVREWIRDWMELPYISPYDDVSNLDQSSREMEKRNVGVFHELLSLSLYKRVAIPILGKFSDEYRFSNAFSNVFTRHSGIFYVSLKGGIKTAMLREAYKDSELVDRDPLLEIKNKFLELLSEGHRQRADQLRLQREMVQEDMKMMAVGNTRLDDQKYEEELLGEEEDAEL
ncbi:hypothetical protein K7X08_011092 [Anisodus acutangulus]|uniref:PORR domain-containing protein n=1 Tax=Anisodus acutangulus TaxID=402998 RepID=A0A9Q1RAT5_9SOLA|nr:hypothetical protein K7X08_011092 [Anisodus acutangulus]